MSEPSLSGKGKCKENKGKSKGKAKGKSKGTKSVNQGAKGSHKGKTFIENRSLRSSKLEIGDKLGNSGMCTDMYH